MHVQPAAVRCPVVPLVQNILQLCTPHPLSSPPSHHTDQHLSNLPAKKKHQLDLLYHDRQPRFVVSKSPVPLLHQHAGPYLPSCQPSRSRHKPAHVDPMRAHSPSVIKLHRRPQFHHHLPPTLPPVFSFSLKKILSLAIYRLSSLLSLSFSHPVCSSSPPRHTAATSPSPWQPASPTLGPAPAPHQAPSAPSSPPSAIASPVHLCESHSLFCPTGCSPLASVHIAGVHSFSPIHATHLTRQPDGDASSPPTPHAIPCTPLHLHNEPQSFHFPTPDLSPPNSPPREPPSSHTLSLFIVSLSFLSHQKHPPM